MIEFEGVKRVSDGMVCEKCGSNVTISGFYLIGKYIEKNKITTRFRCKNCKSEFRQTVEKK